jgi:acyl-coenzyme A thioesterase PaaI-like protein
MESRFLNMIREDQNPNPLLRTWERCQRWPGGKRLFSHLLGRRVPYSGSIVPVVEELTPGYARVRMRDRPKLGNHLRSIHAVALTNLGELTSGLAMTTVLPATARGIPIKLEIEFWKKARGEIVAEGRATPPNTQERGQHEVEAILKDSAGDRVARFTACWIVGPRD